MKLQGLSITLLTGLILLLLTPFTSTTWAQEANGAEASVVWEQLDLGGDDNGPGTYTYPTHGIFEPGLFDLLAVRVWDGGDSWFVDTQFALLANPWRAPEGFGHQAVDIYIDTESGKGATSIPHPEGPKVKLPAGWGWEYRMRIRPWERSRLYNQEGNETSVSVFGLPDHRTIRATVPKKAMPNFSRDAGIIVLVGGYDPYGIDYFRKVAGAASDWRFGGGDEAAPSPNVIDILAPEQGRYQQRQQLLSFTASDGGYATVRPVYLKSGSPHIFPVLTLGMLIVALILLTLILTRRLQWQKG